MSFTTTPNQNDFWNFVRSMQPAPASNANTQPAGADQDRGVNPRVDNEAQLWDFFSSFGPPPPPPPGYASGPPPPPGPPPSEPAPPPGAFNGPFPFGTPQDWAAAFAGRSRSMRAPGGPPTPPNGFVLPERSGTRAHGRPWGHRFDQEQFADNREDRHSFRNRGHGRGGRHRSFSRSRSHDRHGKQKADEDETAEHSADDVSKEGDLAEHSAGEGLDGHSRRRDGDRSRGGHRGRHGHHDRHAHRENHGPRGHGRHGPPGSPGPHGHGHGPSGLHDFHDFRGHRGGSGHGRGGRGGHPLGHGRRGAGPSFDMSGLMQALSSHPIAQAFAPFILPASRNAPEHSGENVHDNDEQFVPPIDVFDASSAYVIHISLPGAKKEDIGVNWDADKGELNIAGVIHRQGDEAFIQSLTQAERKIGVFERNIKLPPIDASGQREQIEIDGDDIAAKLEDGVLVVTVRKLEREWTDVKKVNID